MINTSYLIEQYLQHAGWPKYNRLNNTYNASCPICREGNSWGKKKRSYLLVDKQVVCCHNCGWYGSAVKWVMQVTGMSYDEVQSNITTINVNNTVSAPQPTTQVDILPNDSINLLDSEQVKYWSKDKTVRHCINYLVSRRLHIACNRPKSLYISLTDPIHRNRLCIPFMYNNVVEHYQTRGILDVDLRMRPKYLSKLNSEKTLFNVDNINPEQTIIYITEGPIDAFFIKNAVAVAGIQSNSKNKFSSKQTKQIREYLLHKQVWCLDSQYLDETSLQKTRLLIESGESVFIWPSELGNTYKDFNDYCVGEQVNEFPEDILKEHTYKGESAMMRLTTVELDLRRTSGLSILSGFALST